MCKAAGLMSVPDDERKEACMEFACSDCACDCAMGNEAFPLRFESEQAKEAFVKQKLDVKAVRVHVFHDTCMGACMQEIKLSACLYVCACAAPS